MKRFFALAALVLGLAACQTEPEGLDVNVGGEVDSYVTVSLPETTRANSALGAFDNVVTSDAYTIRYIFQVFYGEAESLATRQVIYTDNDQVSFPVRLVPDRHYNFVVWADVVPQGDKTMNEIVDYDAAADYHYNTANLKDIKIIDVDGGHEWEEMDETRDAFTGQYDTAVDGDKTTYNGAKNISFSLTRPFAKLRVITTDMEQLNDLVITPTSAEVEYTTDLYSSFNAFAGAVNESAKLNKTHETFEIKAYEDNATDESMVLFTDYLFATDQDEVVNFTLTVYDQGDVVIGKTINFNTPIPARRNYLTTISGNILTDGNKIEVTVTDEFANAGSSTTAPYYQETISSVAELLAAIDANNGEYILISDLDVNGVTASALAATRATGAGTTINLNGYTITLKTNLTIPQDKTLTINNDPVDNAADKLGAVVNAGGKLVNKGTLNIEGGEFGENTIENNGKVNVNGDDVHENAIDNKDNAVVGSFIYSAAELQVAVNAASDDVANEFTLAADIEGDVVVVIQQPNVKITIDGAGYTFNGYFRVHSNSNHHATAAVTFKNIKFETSTASVNFIEALEKSNEQRYSTNITIEGCTFTATGDAVNTAVGANVKATRNFVMNGCEGKNLHSLLQANSCGVGCPLVIKNCKAINCKGGISFTQVLSSVVENVEIDALGYGIRYDGRVDNYGITVKNCNITAAQPFIVRKMTGKNNTIALEGTNTLTSTGEAYQIVITNDSDDAAYVAPTGTYTLTGADDFIVYPRDVVSSWAEFTAALAANKTSFLLAEDITYDANYQLQKDVTIDLNGKSMTLPMINIHKAVTIKNGTINGKVYARKNSNITFDNVTFSGAVSDNLSTEGHLAVQGGCDIFAKDCVFNASSVSGSQTKALSIEGRSSGTVKFENCDFKNKYKKNVYVNALSGTATLYITNCNFNGKAPSIDMKDNMFGNYTLTGNKSGSDGFTFTMIDRTKDEGLTDEDIANFKSIINSNTNFTKIKYYFAGGVGPYYIYK